MSCSTNVLQKVMTIIKSKLTRKSLDIQMTKMRSLVKVMTILISRLTRKHVFHLIHLLHTAHTWSSQCKAAVMVIQIPVSTKSLSWSWPAMSPCPRPYLPPSLPCPCLSTKGGIKPYFQKRASFEFWDLKRSSTQTFLIF